MSLFDELLETQTTTEFSTSSLSEKCGVFGIASPKTLPMGALLYYGLYALQHRGQESCGMAVFDSDQLLLHKNMGLVNQVFTQSIVDEMRGQIAIGHTRYSTTGASSLVNAQPVVGRSAYGALVIAHNGNLINLHKLRERFRPVEISGFASESDTHVLIRCLAEALRETHGSLSEAAMRVLNVAEGAFSVVVAVGDQMIAARDRYGIRPLCMGRLDDETIVVASETSALDIVGAAYIRDLEPGEVLLVRRDGTMESRFMSGVRENRFCIFEYIYFSRPDSRLMGQTVYDYRLNIGRLLAKAMPVEADMVIPVPDSGCPAAVGYSQASGIPYVEGLIKNRYVGRTFIAPTQSGREQGLRLKLNPLTDIIRNKRVIVVDDSIVRGNTSRRLVSMLRQAGVKELHLRVSSAPVRHPCYYGIDMSTEEQLIANRMDLETLRQWLDVDTLAYLSLEDMKAAATADFQPCMACFDNDYPAGRPENPMETSCCGS